MTSSPTGRAAWPTKTLLGLLLTLSWDVWSGGVMTLFVGALLMLGVLPVALYALWSRDDGWPRDVARAGVLLLAMATSLGLFVVNRATGLSVAPRLVDAIVTYERRHGAYPPTLDALVSAGLIDEVPAAAPLRVLRREFQYTWTDNNDRLHPHLRFVVVTPFLRHVYCFDAERWMVVD